MRVESPPGMIREPAYLERLATIQEAFTAMLDTLSDFAIECGESPDETLTCVEFLRNANAQARRDPTSNPAMLSFIHAFSDFMEAAVLGANEDVR